MSYELTAQSDMHEEYVPEVIDTTAAPAQPNPLMKVHQYLRGRYKWAIPLGLILGMACAGAGYKLVPVKYLSSGAIRVKSNKPFLLNPNVQRGDGVTFSDPFMDAQIYLLGSQRIAQKAMDTPQWRAVSKEAPLSLSEFMDAMEVDHRRSTEIISISFRDKNPERAKVAVEQIIAAYREISTDFNSSGLGARMLLLSNRKRELTESLAKLRAEVLEMAKNYGSDDLTRIYLARLDRMSKLEDSLQEIKVTLAYAMAMTSEQAATTQPGAATQAAVATRPTRMAPEDVAAREQVAARSDPQLRELLEKRAAARDRVNKLRAGGLASASPAVVEQTVALRRLEEEVQAELVVAQEMATREEMISKMDPDLRNLLDQRTAGIRNIELLKRKGYGANHPSMLDQTIMLANLDEEIPRRVKHIQDQLEKVAGPNAMQEVTTDLDQFVIKAKRNLGQLQPLYDTLSAEVKELGRTQLDIQAKKEQIAIVNRDLDEVRSTIERETVELPMAEQQVDYIMPDMPLRPDRDKRMMVAGAGGMGGLVFGVGLFLAIGFFDRRLKTVADARDSLDRSNRILGILPALPDDLGDPHQANIAAFCVHHIRTLLQIGGRGTANNVIAVTSASPGDGKTSLVLSLGLSYAATGARTLMIDSDLIGAGLTSRVDAIARRKIGAILLRNGQITKTQLTEALTKSQESGKRLGEVLLELGFVAQAELDRALSVQKESNLGLLDVLDGEPLSECIIDGWSPNLSVLAMGNVGASHAGQISLTAVRRIIAEARANYDVVLVDTGPILGSLEACIIAAAVDEVIVTVARGQQRPLVDKTFMRLREIGARVAGIVFNRAPREDVEHGGYLTSAVSQRFQPSPSPAPGTNGHGRVNRLGPVVRAMSSEPSPTGTGDEL